MRAFVAALVPVTLALAGCGGDGESVSGSRTVVAAFYPVAWAAARISGDRAEVVNLTPPGVEPHDLELSARDVERVRDADLVLYLGGGFMPALEDAVWGHESAVDLLDAVPRPPGGEGGEEHADPHAWLDPERFAAIARAIADALGAPHSADALVAELDRLDAEFREGLTDCDRREIVTSHAAFGYLADAYGLRQIALTGLFPEAEPTPKALERLVAEVKAHVATTVFFETLVSPRLAETVAREAGIAAAALNPLEGLTEEELAAGEDYLSVMRANLSTLREALGCR